MQKKIFTGFLCSLLLLSCKASPDTGEDYNFDNVEFSKSVIQALKYEDSGKIIYNPDMGFYSVLGVKVKQDDIEIKNEYMKRLTQHNPICADGVYPEDKEIREAARFNQLLIEFDISDFSSRNENGIEKQDGKIVHLPIEKIKEVLELIKSSGKTAFIRFAYDPKFNGDGKKRDVEPEDFDVILAHIEDICLAIKDYSQIISAVQCGMIGPWGEMNFTSYSKYISKTNFENYSSKYELGLDSKADKSNNRIENGYLILVMRQFTKCLEKYNCDVPLLVRQPRFIYDYIKRRDSSFSFDCQNVPAIYSPGKNNREFYRLGLYNDGYLFSDSDSGTFTIDRAQETEFIKEFTNHTPYGGELIGDYNLTSANSSSMDEMYINHLSYLNIGYKESEFLKFNKFNYQGEAAFKYLIKHLGYRYFLSGSEFSWNDEKTVLKINLNFVNNGFAELPYHRKKIMTVIFEKEEEAVLEKKINGLLFDGKEKTFDIGTADLPEGQYTLYLKISDDDGEYPIQLANDLWNEKLKATKIGEFKK